MTELGKIYIFNTIALVLSFTQIHQSLQIAALTLTCIYTLVKISKGLNEK